MDKPLPRIIQPRLVLVRVGLWLPEHVRQQIVANLKQKPPRPHGLG
jgi:hypothetical protein